MRKSIYLGVFLCLIFSSCFTYRELTKEEAERVFEHKVNYSKSELKSKLLIFVNEKYVSAKSALQTADDGIISGNFYKYLGSYDPMGTQPQYGEFTFIIKYYDNGYKIKILVKSMETRGSKGISDFPSNVWATYSKELQQVYENTDKEVFDYLSSKQTEF